MKSVSKVALVTGGSRGIGRAIALAFAKEGADVAINFVRDSDAAAKTCGEIKSLGRSRSFRADTSSSAQVKDMFSDVLHEFGRIDIFVNNAGVVRRRPFPEISGEEWDLVMAVNLKGYFLCGQAVARHMIERKQAKIINISSVGSIVAGVNATSYSVSKAGVAALTRHMSLELAQFGINVNAIAPGLIETDLNRKDLENPEFRQRRLSLIPLKLVGKPEDVAGAAVYLASDDSKLVTGSTIFVDGGRSIL